MGAVIAAHWSGSRHIANASRVSGLIFVASMLLWAANKDGGVWRYAVLDLFALAYFFQNWVAPNAQHRQFHFLMMLSYLASTSFYAFRGAISAFPIDALGMTEWWYELISNVLFELELIFIAAYAFLYRRARADKRKFRTEVASWFERAAKIRWKIFRGR